MPEANDLAAVILAAGRGTRMKSDLPKVLHPLAGLPMVRYPLDLAVAIGCRPVVLVVGTGGDQVAEALTNTSTTFVRQEQPLGTGHALACTSEALETFSGTLLLLCGDVPLLRPETARKLVAEHRRGGHALTVLTTVLDDPTGYGRIFRSGSQLQRIVEEADADTEEKALREVNAGIYALQAPLVFRLLEQVGQQNRQGEFYLTDLVEIAREQGLTVGAVTAEAEETLGVNDRQQLARCAALLRQRINGRLMDDGVSIVDPASVYIDFEVEVGRDTVIHPGAHLRGRTRVGAHCTIEPGAVIGDSILAEHVHVKAGSVLQEVAAGSHADIGPMAHLRPGTVLAGGNKIGNFVETKKAVIGPGSKASHLTYLGDAEIGAEVNIGCGTITCNYDGVRKHRTVIEDGVFVGSDVQLVAPVKVGRGSLIGAGSTIVRDVPADALAISRSEQKNVAGWAARKRKKNGRK